MLNVNLNFLIIIISAKKNIRLKYIDNLTDKNNLKYINFIYFTITINIDYKEITEANILINEWLK